MMTTIHWAIVEAFSALCRMVERREASTFARCLAVHAHFASNVGGLSR